MPIKILLADDSLTIQKVVELTFSDAETRLMAVGSGDRAVQALDDFQPDIVLADVVMPGRTGYEVCEAVKKRPGGAFVPVVLLTGTFEPFDRNRAELVGSDAIVTKPFDSHALQGLVRELVGKARAAREEAESAPTAVPAAAAAPEPPPTVILSPAELEEAFPTPAPPVVDTASTLVLSPIDLSQAAPPFAEAAASAPAAESIYATMAMKIPTPEELEESARREGIVLPQPAAVPEAASAPFAVDAFELEAPPPPPPAFYEAEPSVAPPPPPAFHEAEPSVAPPPPPAFYEAEPSVAPPPPPAFYEAEPEAVPPPPVFAEDAHLEAELSPAFEPEASPGAEEQAPASLASEEVSGSASPFEEPAAEPARSSPELYEPEPAALATAPVPGPAPEPVRLLARDATETLGSFATPLPDDAVVEAAAQSESPFEIALDAADGSPVEAAEAPPASLEPGAQEEEPAFVLTPEEPAPERGPAEPVSGGAVSEPFPEMAGGVPDEEAAPWDEGPVVEIPPPPPELAGGPRETEEAEPITRDLEADLEAFESSGRVRRRPEIWEKHAALIGEETPPDIDVPGAVPAPAEAPQAPSSDGADLEQIAAAARLEDLSRLIPAAPLAAAAEAVVTTAPIAPPAPASLSDAEVDRIARRVVELLSDKVVRDIAWEVVPDVAVRLVRERIDEVERAG